MKIIVDYIWLSGDVISKSKYVTKVVKIDTFFPFTRRKITLSDIPKLKFDGNYTNQDCDCSLKPVRLYKNPNQKNKYYVICEVFAPHDVPHASNSRRALWEYVNVTGFESMIHLSEKCIIYRTSEDLTRTRKGIDAHSQHHSSNSYFRMGQDVIDMLIPMINKMGIDIDLISTFDRKWVLEMCQATPLLAADDIMMVRHLLYRISVAMGLSVNFDALYFVNIVDEKDKIIDPYLIAKKIVKSRI